MIVRCIRILQVKRRGRVTEKSKEDEADVLGVDESVVVTIGNRCDCKVTEAWYRLQD